MRYVYVVTFSPLGEDRGEFFEEIAWRTEASAAEALVACQRRYGGVGSYTQQRINPSERPWVIERWDNDRTSVWLERLEVQG